MFQQNISLKPYNTFGIDVRASFFIEISQLSDLQGIIANPMWQRMSKLLLGGGSNILFTKNFEGLVIKINLLGIEKSNENEDFVWLRVGAGENWHQFVTYTIDNNYGGIENLALIYGTVGAAPMQNIGAYGVEIKDVVEHVEAMYLETGEMATFTPTDCQFGYRQSIFKTTLKHKVVITHVTFKLTKRNHVFKTTYGAISQYLTQQNITTLNLRAISDAVIAIRQSKLPNPSEIGNAGSFFKNPEIPLTQFKELQQKFPTCISYPTENQTVVKVPAGWLIEQCGWKGKRMGDVGVHKDQALVVVNYGHGTGTNIWELAQAIQKTVLDNFGIELTMEVNVY